MSKKSKVGLALLVVTALLVVMVVYLSGSNLEVLNSKGVIADKERNLIIFTLALSLIVVIPVYLMTVGIAWRYREANKNARYSPDFDGSRPIETAWWIIPGIIISILSVVAWNSSHQLDPFRSVYASAKPLPIQVVALQWKWLFIYPQQNIATVNFVQFPVNTPIDFVITADAPMNSFWIPQLSGQIYAMPGMATQLHLIASQAGHYRGSSANISGQGFAGMVFTAKASSSSDFNQWLRLAKHAPAALNVDEYNMLAKPSLDNAVKYYSYTDDRIFAEVVHKFMPNTAIHAHGIE